MFSIIHFIHRRIGYQMKIQLIILALKGFPEYLGNLELRMMRMEILLIDIILRFNMMCLEE